MTLQDWLASRPDRCPAGFAPIQHPVLCACTPPPDAEWVVFTAALRSAVRADGTVHQCDVRPLIRGRIDPKAIGRFYRRARNDGLLVDTQRREESDDRAGRNTDKLDRIYAMRGAA